MPDGSRTTTFVLSRETSNFDRIRNSQGFHRDRTRKDNIRALSAGDINTSTRIDLRAFSCSEALRCTRLNQTELTTKDRAEHDITFSNRSLIDQVGRTQRGKGFRRDNHVGVVRLIILVSHAKCTKEAFGTSRALNGRRCIHDILSCTEIHVEATFSFSRITIEGLTTQAIATASRACANKRFRNGHTLKNGQNSIVFILGTRFAEVTTDLRQTVLLRDDLLHIDLVTTIRTNGLDVLQVIRRIRIRRTVSRVRKRRHIDLQRGDRLEPAHLTNEGLSVSIDLRIATDKCRAIQLLGGGVGFIGIGTDRRLEGKVGCARNISTNSHCESLIKVFLLQPASRLQLETSRRGISVLSWY